jgi:hypothetical protein
VPSDLLAVARQRLTQRRQLQRNFQRPHLRCGLAAGAERVEQLEVGVDRGVGGVDIGDVLAKVVDTDQAPRIAQLLYRIHRVGNGFAGHEPVYHLASDGQPLSGPSQPFLSAGRQDHRARDPVEELCHHSVSMCG